MSRDFKIGVVSTVYSPASHTDVIVSRWLEPRPGDVDWGWQTPKSRIASLSLQQFPEIDVRTLPDRDSPGFRTDVEMGRFICEKHGIPLFDSVRDALTLGGDSLAVDGVLLIGEHGDYPFNALHQKLYPRKELFDEIVAVFREAGKVVPLFCDKHLSWNPAWALEMSQTVREMGIPFLAGSSLPLVGLTPPVPDLSGKELSEYVGIYYVGPEAYGFHSLELMQSLIEKRSGGETGICRITAFVGDEVESAMSGGEWSEELFDAALSKAENVREGRWQDHCRGVKNYEGTIGPAAFVIEHVDGFRSAHVLLEGHLSDFVAALRLKDGSVFAGRNANGGAESFYGHFASLNAQIETLFLTGKTEIPPERTLLTTLAIAACMKALQTPGVPVETPELRISY